MRSRSPGVRLPAIALTLTGTTLPALASGDVLIMPFRCGVVDGKPVLTPTREDQGYRILTQRQARKVETCSTVLPNFCRQWSTFKFDLDCGGTRVSWMQVFANASEHTRRRVSESDGRLRVSDTTARNRRLDDVCARRLGPQMDWGTTAERCDEVSPVNAPTFTVMPAGFAPMVGLDATILPAKTADRLGLSVAEAAPPLKQLPTPASSDRVASEAPASSDTPQRTAPDDTSARPDPPAETAALPEPPAETTAPSPAADLKIISKAPEPAAAAPSEPSDAQRQSASSEPPDLSEPAQPAENSQPVATPATTDATPEGQSAAVDAPPPTSAAPSEATAPKAANGSDPAVRPASVAALAAREASQASPASTARPAVIVAESPVVPSATVRDAADGGSPERGIPVWLATIAGGLLAMTLLGVYWLSRPQPSKPPGREPEFDAFASHSGAPSPTDPHVSTALALVATSSQTKFAPQPRSPASAARTLTIGDRMPLSRTEALEILGLGVTSDGNQASLKKIIDGLRMNWHPDHAHDDADRRIRELRMKQINAAWDILDRQPAEV